MLHKKNYIHNGPNCETHEEDQIVYVGFNDALLSSLLDPLEGLGMLSFGKLELGAAPDFQH
jgi:hypothetical protein